MNLKFGVEKQLLIRQDDEIPVEKSQNYLYINFQFSADWNGKKKFAYFCNNEDEELVKVEIIDDSVLVPWEKIKYPFFFVLH